MSTSIELIVAYLRERLRSRLFVPLALLLAIAGMVAAGAQLDSLGAFVETTITCYLLVLAFRLWDDLEDRARDRREHPERVMARSTRIAPWMTLLALAFIGAAIIVAAGPSAGQRLATLAAGSALLFAWYRLRRPIAANPLIGMHVIFAKYPLIALVAAPPARPTSLGLSAAVLFSLYAALCMYELIDDAALRGSIP
jgi:4-hydroxybenzoate polyprenyltransferase